MSITVIMPEVAETVVEGTVAKWLKQPGDRVEIYESVAEIVTDKVNIELPSPATGQITEILVPEGKTVSIGTPLAVLETEGEVSAEPVAPSSTIEAAPSAAHVAAPPETTKAPTRRDKRYSPLVLKLAQEHRVDLSKVEGTGAGGRVSKADVLEYVERSKVGSSVTVDEIRIGPIRRSIAQRMLQSAQEIPHAWTMIEADVSELVAVVQTSKDRFREQEGINLTYLPFMVQAVCSAFKEQPLVNSSWTEDRVMLHKEANIGIAVARDEGLIVPVIKKADQKTIADLAKEIHRLVERARQNKLEMGDVQGGTFTVNNTGALGSVLSMPLINPGQAAIITSEAVMKRPVVINDDIVVRSMMNLCLSFDHRILDGAIAIQFLQQVRAHLEAVKQSIIT